MSSSRPPRDNHYDSRNDNDDGGFKIRGRASRNDAWRRDDYSRSPPSRRYNDVDAPYREDKGRGRGRYNERSDHRYDRRFNKYYDSRYDASSSDYQPREHGYPEAFYDEPAPEPDSTGEEDVSTNGAPLQILLIRGLKSTVDEDLLAKGLEKFYRDDSLPGAQSQPAMPTQLPGIPRLPSPGPPGIQSQPRQPGATPCSLRCVFVIRDRVTRKSMGYGFAEYHTVADAKAALAKATTMGDRCTISSKKITIDYPHFGVFPIVVPGQNDDDTRFAFKLAGDSLRKYRDSRYYASGSMVNPDPPSEPKSATPPNDANTKVGKKRTANSQAGDVLGVQSNKKTKKSKPEFKMAQEWQKKQAELRGENGDEDEEISNPPDVSGTKRDSEPGQTHLQSFVILLKKKDSSHTCVLCGIALHEHLDPARHVKESPKHADNLKDEVAYKRAFERLKIQGVDPDDTVQIKVDSSKHQRPADFIDRAKMRRQQEAKAGAPIKMSLKGIGQKKVNLINKNEPAAPQPPTYGIGMKMMQKSGWSEGESLGGGNGMTQPIEQNMYAAGVGLGHESSKKGDAVEEAHRMTAEDRGSFVEKTKDMARERFGKMG